MSNFIYDAISAKYGHRTTPSGWTRFNGPCCPYVNQQRDTKQRAGVKLDGNEMAYSCFNCGFGTRYTEGLRITRKTQNLLTWMGFTAADIGKFQHAAQGRKMKAEGRIRISPPDEVQSIQDWLDQGCEDGNLLRIADMLTSGDPIPDLTDIYWTPNPNGLDLHKYLLWINGGIEYPTSWMGYAPFDDELPPRNQDGIDEDPEDDFISQNDLDDFQTLVEADENA